MALTRGWAQWEPCAPLHTAPMRSPPEWTTYSSKSPQSPLLPPKQDKPNLPFHSHQNPPVLKVSSPQAFMGASTPATPLPCSDSAPREMEPSAGIPHPWEQVPLRTWPRT